jgi:glucokinase
MTRGLSLNSLSDRVSVEPIVASINPAESARLASNRRRDHKPTFGGGNDAKAAARQMSVLLGDIGGTYARFALAGKVAVGPVWSIEVSGCLDAKEAIAKFLAIQPAGTRIDGALLAAAGPVEGGRCKLTNAAWTLDEEKIAQTFDLPWTRIVNDLEAVAAGLSDLPTSQTRLIGPDGGLPGAPMAIVAPGTGLGMACLVSGPRGRLVLAGEGGHASLAAIDDEHAKLIAILRRELGHVSAERVLSGNGLANLYRALAMRDGVDIEPRTPAEVTDGALSGSCMVCRAALDAFCDWLGAVAGDLALTIGARGGVFIGGGIVPRFIDHFAASSFRRQFQAKGRLQPYLARIPTRVILHPTPAFLGLTGLLADARAYGRVVAA